MVHDCDAVSGLGFLVHIGFILDMQFVWQGDIFLNFYHCSWRKCRNHLRNSMHTGYLCLIRSYTAKILLLVLLLLPAYARQVLFTPDNT